MEITDRYAARLLMLSFFLPMKLQVWVTMAISVYFIFRAVQAKQTAPAKNYMWATILGSGLLLFLIALPFTPHEYAKVVRSAMEHKVSLLFIPFVFAVAASMFRHVLMKELIYFVYGCVAICIMANVNFAYHYFTGATHDLSHVAYRTGIHYFTDVHPTYLSMYLCLSICIMLLASKLDIWVHPIILNVLLYLAFIFLLALGAKTPILALVLILVHYGWVHRSEFYKYRVMFFGLLVTAVLAGLFVPFISQRVNEMVQFFGPDKHGTAADNSVYAREAIWNMDMALLQQNWLTGVGPGKVAAVMEAESAARSIPTIYHDPHNEYVYEWLCFGIAGIVLFVTVLFFHLRQALRYKDHLYLYLLIIFCATFLTETVLSLQRGILLYAIFTSLLFFRNKRDAIASPI